MQKLLTEIRSCTHCHDILPHDPNPVVSGSDQSKVLIIGQAPGRKVHETGIAWNDPSGDLLRKWLNVSKDVFYNPELIALVPMGFCYPGKGTSGDLPPRPECAEKWHKPVMSSLESVRLTILIGSFAQKHYLKSQFKENLTETVYSFKEYLPAIFPLPHPSPRNRHWLSKNQWFETKLLPVLGSRIREVLG